MNRSYAVVAENYYDGERLFRDGPYTVLVERGVVEALVPADLGAELARRGLPVQRLGFLMPGLVEAHGHLFLDGGELDFAARNDYLNADYQTMLEVARRNLAAHRAAGVTLVVDAGDRYRVNDGIRIEAQGVTVRSAGLALRRPGRYGGFMAREVAGRDEIVAAVDEIAAHADDLKVILTGIIDFKAGSVKGEPQFSADELAFIVELARERGVRTFVHCSGVAGIETAVAAGVDSIEHGFFMAPEHLKKMADRGIAWVPTFSPVHFQWQRPELAGWDPPTVAKLRGILDGHLEQVALAARLGVPLVAGSDAGSPGVCHGPALIDELAFFSSAGLPMAYVLRSATSLPRERWGVGPTKLARGSRAEFIGLAGSPFADPAYLRQVVAVFGDEIEAAEVSGAAA